MSAVCEGSGDEEVHERWICVSACTRVLGISIRDYTLSAGKLGGLGHRDGEVGEREAARTDLDFYTIHPGLGLEICR